MVHFPAQVSLEGFGEDVGAVGHRHHHVVLEAFFADVAHESLEVGHAGHGPVAEGVQRVVGQFSVADVGADRSFGVGRSDATVGQRPRGRTAVQRPVGVLLTGGRTNDGRGGDLDVGQEGFSPVAAVEEDALVVVVRVIVVPVHQRRRRVASELHGVHREHAGDIHLTGARHEPLAHHAHERAHVAAVVSLDGSPALDRRRVDGVGVHPLAERHTHLRHLHEY